MVVYRSLFTVQQCSKTTVVTCPVSLNDEALIRLEALRSRATLLKERGQKKVVGGSVVFLFGYAPHNLIGEARGAPAPRH
ncbi:hypothetical protein EVAR_101782_1 [Eumeta japonica]|uniref:Uncharacterized protein n=1 Tax=Eumeta variegata TaxID=151549 RepID=A0A4C1SQ95_EUMVA|nr:hypothetical protein EVAR_101782_1 [Eumeta japonica]